MPFQKTVPPTANPAFLDDLMERLSGVLPLLERDETVRLLRALHSSVLQEIAWDKGLAARQAGASSTGYQSPANTRLSWIYTRELNEPGNGAFHQDAVCPGAPQELYRVPGSAGSQGASTGGRGTCEGGQEWPSCPVCTDQHGERWQGGADPDYRPGPPDCLWGWRRRSADHYFRAFSEILVERLAEIGFKKCTGDIMPSNPTWRGSSANGARNSSPLSATNIPITPKT